MDVVYGVGVANRFAFLHDDEEEDEEETALPKMSINSPEVPKKKGVKEEESKLIPKKQSNLANEVKSSASKKEITRGGGSKGQGQRKERREKENDAESRPQRRSQQGSNRDGPQRRFRGRMTSPENKKADDDAEDEKTEENAENKSNNVDDAADADKERVKEEGELSEENEPEQVTITLKEWKAMQAPREKPVFNIRKPGEGEDPRFLEKFVLKKKEDNGDVVNEDAGDYEDEIAFYPQRAGKTKQIADVGFTTGYQRRRIGRGGGGGRGRYGGGDAQENCPDNEFAENGRGRRRGDKHGAQYQRRPAPVPRFDDTRDFPTLG